MKKGDKTMPSLPNKVYDWMKYICVIVLPSIGTAYVGISKYIDIPYADAVPGIISVICTFLGAILCISTAQYNLAQAKEFTDFPENIEE